MTKTPATMAMDQNSQAHWADQTCSYRLRSFGIACVLVCFFVFVGCGGNSDLPPDSNSGSTEQKASDDGGFSSLGYGTLPDTKENSRRFAILIGINEYADDSLPDLKRAANDAQGLNEMLVDEFGYQPHDVLHLSNQNATKAQIEHACTGWLQDRKISSSDSLLFFFAGHGQREGYLAATDSQKGDAWQSWIDLSWLVQKVRALPCRHKLLVLDSCYSGALFKKRRETVIQVDGESVAVDPQFPIRGGGPQLESDSFAKYAQTPCFLGISAGRHTAVVDELGEDNHSLFTWALLESMKERAMMNRDDQQFLGRMLLADVERRVASVRQSPQRVNWGYLDDGDGDFVFAPTTMRKTPAIVSEDRRKKIKIRLFVRDLRAAKVAIAEGDRSKALDLLIKHMADAELKKRFDGQFLLALARSGNDAAIRKIDGYLPVSSPDSNQVATRYNQGVAMTDVATGKHLGQLPDYNPVLFLQDGKSLLVKHRKNESFGRLNVGDGELKVREMDPLKNVGFMVRSAHGNVVVNLNDQSISIWETQPKFQFRRTLGNQDYVYTRVAISGDGALVAAAEYVPRNVLDRSKRFTNKRVVVFDSHTGEQLTRFNDHRSDITDLAFSPDGGLVAIARSRPISDAAAQRPLSGNDEEIVSKIRLFYPRTGKPALTLDSFRSGTSSLAFSPDGTILVAGDNPSIDNLEVSSHHSYVTFYDLWSGQKSYQWEVGSFEGSGGLVPAVSGLAFTANGNSLVVSDGTGTYLWGGNTSVEEGIKPPDEQPSVLADTNVRSFALQGTPISISRSGRYVDTFSDAIEGDSRKVYFRRWDTKTEKIVHEVSTSIDQKYDGLDWKPSGSGQLPLIWADGFLRQRDYLVLSYCDGKIFSTSWQADRSKLSQISWSPDSRYLLTTEYSRLGVEVKIWDVAKNRRVSRLAGMDSIFPPAWTSNGKYVIGGLEQSVDFVVCSARTGKQVQQIQTNGNYISFVATSGNGRVFVAWSETSTTAAHGLGKYRQHENYFEAPFTRKAGCLAVNEDATLFVTGHEDGSVWLWDFEIQAVLHTFSGTHSSPVRCACITKQGQIITASHDGIVEIRELPAIDHEQFYSDPDYDPSPLR